MSEQDNLETQPSNLPENQDQQQNSEPQVQPSNQPAIQQAEFDRIANMARVALESAANLRAENERLQREAQVRNSTPQVPEYDFEALNNRVREGGQFGETTVEIVRRELQAAVRPLIEHQQRDARKGEIARLTAQAVANHPYGHLMQPHTAAIAVEMEKQLGNAEPNLGFITLVLKGMVADAMMAQQQNPAPQNISNNNPNIPNPNPPVNRPPAPLQTPGTRPAPVNTQQNDLTEAEKRVKAHLDPENKYSAKEFKELYYSNIPVEFDVTQLANEALRKSEARQ